MLTNKSKKGFTLVEILVISPLVLMLVAGLIAAIVNITGKSLASRSQGVMIDEVHSTIDTMEVEIGKATELPYSIPQSKVASPMSLSNNSAAITTSRTQTLIIKTPATTKSPLSDARSLVYVNDATSGGCSGDLTDNPIYSVYYIYFLDSSGTLWRRVLKDTTNENNICNTPWQRNSCKESHIQGACSTSDTRLASNVETFNIEFYPGDSGSPITYNNWTPANQPTSVLISLTASKEIAGSPVSVSSSVRVTSQNL